MVEIEDREMLTDEQEATLRTRAEALLREKLPDVVISERWAQVTQLLEYHLNAVISIERHLSPDSTEAIIDGHVNLVRAMGSVPAAKTIVAINDAIDAAKREIDVAAKTSASPYTQVKAADVNQRRDDRSPPKI